MNSQSRWSKVEVIEDAWPAGAQAARRAGTATDLHLMRNGRLHIDWGRGQRTVGAGSLLWVPAGFAFAWRVVAGPVERSTLHLRFGALAPANPADGEALDLVRRFDALVSQCGPRLDCTRSTVAGIGDEMSAMGRLWRNPESRHHRTGLKAGALRLLIALDSDRKLARAVDALGASSASDAAERIEPALHHLSQRNYIDQPHLTVADLARLCGYRPSRFHAVFLEATGLTPQRYLTERRVALACDLLDHSDRRVLDIAFACGFNSQSRFYHAFTTIIGMPPARWRQRPERG